MLHSSTVAPLPVVVSLLGAAILGAIRKWLNRAVADSLGIAFAGAVLVITALLLLHSLHGHQVYWFGNWYPRGSMVLGIAFVIEPVGAGLATLASLLTFLALLFSWRFVDDGGDHLQPLMLVFLGAMCGFALTGDLFNLFVFFELMSTAAFALCGLKTAEPAPLQGSFNFAVTNTIAAFLVLTGIAMLYSITGALNMAQLGLQIGARHDPLVLFAFTVISCGFMTKAAIAPFHLWLPDAHAVAPTPVCVLFSGIMVELGLYAILRIHSAIFSQALAPHAGRLRALLLSFGAITAVLGGVMCYAEHHLKRLLAFSTISHAGLMLVALSMQGALAAAAMLTYLLAHLLLKSLLFFTSGIVLHRLRSISERSLFGKGRPLPWIALLWFAGGLGLAAAPPFCSVIAEAGTEYAAEQAGIKGIWLLFLFAGVFTGAAVLRVGMHTFLGWGSEPLTDSAAEVGELPETEPEAQRLSWYHVVPPALCLIAAVALTFWSGWLPVVQSAAAELVSQPAYLHTVYTGQSVTYSAPTWYQAIPGALLRGTIAGLLAACLAATSLFHTHLPPSLRWGRFLEGDLRLLRAIQSGQPGDYVMWMTVGLALFGSAVTLLLRS